RMFGEESITEPSSFLNELPLELIQNLSPDPSWLGFAARPETRDNRQAAAALRGEPSRPVKKTSNYAGKTYNSVDGVREFFNRRAGSGGGEREPVRDRYKRGTGEHKREKPAGEPVVLAGVEFRVGARVRHARYG